MRAAAVLLGILAVCAGWCDYREVGRINPGFREVRGIAVAGGLVYVAGDRAVRVYSLDGKQRGGVLLHGDPQCLAVDKDGTAYVGMTDHVVVVRGKKLLAWPAPSASAIVTCVSVGPSGVWVADAAARQVIRYSRDGKVLGRLCRRAAGYSGLVVPSAHLDVVEGKNGIVWVANPGMHRVEAHAVSGKYVRAWGSTSDEAKGFCGCCNPTDFAVFPDGRFVTAEKGIARVKVYSSTGVLQAVVAGPSAFADNDVGLDVAVLGERVLVLDPKARAVRIFAPSKVSR